MDFTQKAQSVSRTPAPVARALRKLGHDIRDARRRRRIPVAILAQRASISRMTLNKVEKGDPRRFGWHVRHRALRTGNGRPAGGRGRPQARYGRLGARRGAPAGAHPAPAPEHRQAGKRGSGVMDKEVLVYVDLQGDAPPGGAVVGALRKDRESATFEYDTELARSSLSVSRSSPPSSWAGPVSHAVRQTAVRRHRRLGARSMGAGVDAPRRAPPR